MCIDRHILVNPSLNKHRKGTSIESTSKTTHMQLSKMLRMFNSRHVNVLLFCFWFLLLFFFTENSALKVTNYMAINQTYIYRL